MKLKVKLVLLIILLLFISACCFSQDEKVTLLINQEIIFSSHEQSEENYFVKTRLIARWKGCSKGLKYNKYKNLYTLIDLVKCKDIEKTKIDQMEKIMDYKLSLEACLKINPNIILTK